MVWEAKQQSLCWLLEGDRQVTGRTRSWWLCELPVPAGGESAPAVFGLSLGFLLWRSCCRCGEGRQCWLLRLCSVNSGWKKRLEGCQLPLTLPGLLGGAYTQGLCCSEIHLGSPRGGLVLD